MQIILRADVDNLGRLGEVVKVKPGYGRNYLIPQGLAMPATKANMNIFERERKRLEAKMEKIRQAARSLADKLNAAQVVIPVRVGENDKLYGSVTTTNIGDALSDMGIEVDRRKIVLDNPIRTLGDFEVEVKLHQDVQCMVKVSVVRHGSEPQAVEESVESEAVDTPAEPEAAEAPEENK
ncbi:50S ribosomal protein L9 [Desulfonatronovibrio hydrogenovorans]|uniref:50S ribosomal protein L9 n=1 Tax=Desulfonatronovibrio hydrogenovorans TaxID=53245 RepID=UPI00048FFC75|nr:50S ribosomal protein L9 [Desulfonatronovibrio hydrogenovorans]